MKHSLFFIALAAIFSSILVMMAPTNAPSQKRGGLMIRETGTGSDNDILKLELSDGVGFEAPKTQIPPAEAQPLSEAETKAILDRLPPMTEEAEEKPFHMREGSKPAPRPGKTIKEAFPPQDQRPAPDDQAAGPLEVLRITPQDEVPLAARVSITFSQPMVALTSHDDLALEDLPVRLEPQPQGGKWRWLGTRVLVFDGPQRLPMATEYQVTVPAGTTSQTGGRLEKEVTAGFSTPTAQVVFSYPDQQPQGRDALMALAFDQDINPQDILRHLRISSGGQSFEARPASPDEIEKSGRLKDAQAFHGAKRFLAFRAMELLPLSASVEVELPVGLSSAEGPLKTEEPWKFEFTTYSALRVEEHKCGWWNNCQPGAPWEIVFNNPLDAETYSDDWMQIEPVVPGLMGSVYSNRLNIQGPTKGQTTYTVTLGSKVVDQFGQNLAEPVKLTFKVGDAEEQLFSPGGEFQVLDPTAKPKIPIYTTNHEKLRVQLYIVGPEDWITYTKFMQERWQNTNAKPPGELALDKELNLARKPNELLETLIDLKPALHKGRGQVFVRVISMAPAPKNRPRPEIVRWIQVTDLALDAFCGSQSLQVWTGSLEDGKPLSKVTLELYDPVEKKSILKDVVPNARGMANLTLPSDNANTKILVARREGDLCMLPETIHFWRGRSLWRKTLEQDDLYWHVFNDRGMYKPGETVHVKGWTRLVNRIQGPVAIPDERSLTWSALDARGNEFLKGEAALDDNGGFNLSLEIPDDINLGQANLRLKMKGKADYFTTHQFKVQEFRRPEYEVSVKAPSGPHFAGGSATAEVKASYYAGGGLPDAHTSWDVTAREATFTPPNLDEFTFGHWLPWWRYNGRGSSVSQDHEGITNSSGVHHLRVQFEEARPATARTLIVSAAVRDANNQQWSDSTSFLVHSAQYYVGLRSQQYFVDKGKPFIMEAVAADLDGKLIPGAIINVLVTRREYVFRSGEWKEEEKDPQEFELTSGEEPVSFQFKTEKGGTYRVTAQIRDPEGRVNETAMDRWVSGGGMKPARKVDLEEVTLIPDRKEYQPGDVAKILVMAPFENAEGLITLNASGFQKVERFTLKGLSHQISIPIEDGHMPNIHVQIDLTGAAPRRDSLGVLDKDLPPRPAHATGILDLSVPALKRQLSISLIPEKKELEPGGSTWLDVSVLNAEGNPVEGSEIAVFAVDESILALSSYQLANPIDTFYLKRSNISSAQRLRDYIILPNPDDLRVGGAYLKMADGPSLNFIASESAMAPTAQALRMKSAGAPGAPAPQPIAVRTNFNPLAAWFPNQETDSHGKLRLKIELPDNLTRYRLMAVAVSGVDRFGKGEASLTARLPLMARPSAPRFLNFGDQFSLPVLVQNQTDEPMEVVLVARAQNAVFTEGAGRKVTVPARNRVNVFFPVKTVSAGSARFQFAVSSGDYSDAAEISIPVYTPATSEAFAVYGELDEGVMSQPISMPKGVYPQFGGLQITTSSTVLQSLSDAVLYLANYPYTCLEQRASRILAISALRDILDAFGSSVDPEALKLAVEEDIKAIQMLQNSDGGWGFWRRGEKSWPYISIHAAHALARAQAGGFTVSPQTMSLAKNYLTGIDRHIDKDWSEHTRYSLKAYALRAQQAMGENHPKLALALFRTLPVEKAPMEGLGWLLPLLPEGPEQAAILKHFSNRTEETAATATFTTSYRDESWLLLHSSRRGDGIILDSLIQVQPENDLIAKVVRGLMAGRARGHWLNTQENVFILLAMERYFHAYEGQTPSFTARAWLGEQFVGEQVYEGRSTRYNQVDVPMSWLAENGRDANLVLAHEGKGRLYYRLGMRYAPESLDLKPAAHGFFVERTYEAVDRAEDVTRLEDGTWSIKQGATVRVKLTMVAPSRRHHVALIDPLPAGLEGVNPELNVTPIQPQQQAVVKRGFHYWRSTWFVHQNMRDERVEAFTYSLHAGEYEYSYLARATTPGVFITPPAKAEEMYHPETFGRSASDRVVVQ